MIQFRMPRLGTRQRGRSSHSEQPNPSYQIQGIKNFSHESYVHECIERKNMMQQQLPQLSQLNESKPSLIPSTEGSLTHNSQESESLVDDDNLSVQSQMEIEVQPPMKLIKKMIEMEERPQQEKKLDKQEKSIIDKPQNYAIEQPQQTKELSQDVQEQALMLHFNHDQIIQTDIILDALKIARSCDYYGDYYGHHCPDQNQLQLYFSQPIQNQRCMEDKFKEKKYDPSVIKWNRLELIASGKNFFTRNFRQQWFDLERTDF